MASFVDETLMIGGQARSFELGELGGWARSGLNLTDHELGEIEGHRCLAPESKVDQDQPRPVSVRREQIAGTGVAVCGAERSSVELLYKARKRLDCFHYAIFQIGAERRRDQRVGPEFLGAKYRQHLMVEPTTNVATHHVCTTESPERVNSGTRGQPAEQVGGAHEGLH